MMTTYEKFRRMQDNNIMLSFKGEITSDIITMVLQIAENKLDAAHEKGSVKKKIFNVLVECLQNLYHHAEKDTTTEDPKENDTMLIRSSFPAPSTTRLAMSLASVNAVPRSRSTPML